MSIFRRRSGSSPEPESATPAPTPPQARADGARPAWLPTSTASPAGVDGDRAMDIQPAPYYAPGMPSLHPSDPEPPRPAGDVRAAPGAPGRPQPAAAAAPAAPASAPSVPASHPADPHPAVRLHEPAAETWAAIHSEAAQAAQRDATRLATGADAEDVADAVDDVRVDPATVVAVEEPLPQIAPVSRSGRNMSLASAVGVALLVLVMAAAWWHPLAFVALAGLACVVAVVEWRGALAKHGRRVPLVPVTLVTAGLLVATWFGGPEGLVVALMVGLAGTVAWRVVDERIENTLADSLAAMLTILWIPFLASFLVLLELADDGWQRVVVVILAVVGSDTGGLFAGMLAGKHPMAPRVSPKKTWEGFAGGLLLGTAAASVAAYVFFDGDWWVGALVGLASALAGVLGDLAESAIKRDIRVKDMSSFLPGHGGIMDRVDSLLMAAPVAYVVFGLLLGVS
ncbi:phosphatidate cytidylyltransferase [Demequina sp. NBRC 110053]|uniref:phosphatidate cytidylyltransferase n=1 Tax=Demequina sp. NBRC 110053 TaxID=1570342 RepID=UPI0009FCD5C8|nr:phosphatidate cytidylyltransferase [Demequina sp. NBRC 110053]